MAGGGEAYAKQEKHDDGTAVPEWNRRDAETLRKQDKALDAE
jgi:hypothetical protein